MSPSGCTTPDPAGLSASVPGPASATGCRYLRGLTERHNWHPAEPWKSPMQMAGIERRLRTLWKRDVSRRHRASGCQLPCQSGRDRKLDPQRCTCGLMVPHPSPRSASDVVVSSDRCTFGLLSARNCFQYERLGIVFSTSGCCKFGSLCARIVGPCSRYCCPAAGTPHHCSHGQWTAWAVCGTAEAASHPHLSLRLRCPRSVGMAIGVPAVGRQDCGGCW